MPFKLSLCVLLALPVLLHAAVSSSVTIKSSANPAQLGESVTLTANVSPSRATGSVTFFDGPTLLEIEPVVSGTATFTTTLLPFGTASLKAYYSGDGTYAASTSALVAQSVKTVLARGFGALLNYNTGIEPFAVVTGDFNADGKADLAIANYPSGGLSVLLGDGDGTFQTSVNYALTGEPDSIAVGDFNDDGKPDLVVSVGFGYIAVLFGNGDGTFQAPVYYSASEEAEYVAVGDFNGDGKADIAVGNSIDNTVSIFLGNGDGSFTYPPPAYLPGSYAYSIAIGDFNRDGYSDLAVTGESGSITVVLLGNGDGTFQNAVNYDTVVVSSAVAVGDFNGDGIVDLVVGGDGISVLLGKGDGTFQQAVNYTMIGADNPVSVGDFNGDGIADLSVGGCGVMLGYGDGTFHSPVYSTTCISNSSVLADFNGDGRTDVAFGELDTGTGVNVVGVLLGTNSGPTQTAVTSSLNPSQYNQDVTFTATVSPSTSTGTVTFYHGATILGTADLNNATASITTSVLVGGAHTITATYGGDLNDKTSTSAGLTQLVAKGSDSISLFSSPNPSTLGQVVNLLAKITPATATGTVTFYHGSTVLGTSTVSGGEAIFSTSTLTEGAHSLTATYNGSSNYLTSVSRIVTQTVQ